MDSVMDLATATTAACCKTYGANKPYHSSPRFADFPPVYFSHYSSKLKNIARCGEK